jgi:hypothetical protein
MDPAVFLTERDWAMQVVSARVHWPAFGPVPILDEITHGLEQVWTAAPPPRRTITKRGVRLATKLLHAYLWQLGLL